MMNRRAMLSALLGGFVLALTGKPATSQVRTGRASSPQVSSPQVAMAEADLPADKAHALDLTEAAFSQRPQLHYDRQRQHRRPERRPWRAPRRSRRSRRARRPAGGHHTGSP